jgi:outer membrane lipoprotein carrier protein
MLCATAVFAQETAASLAAKVDSRYNHLKSLECRYRETYDGMGMNRSESGTLLLRKPGRMRWTYDSPKGKVFLLDGKYAISYVPGDAQATRLPIKQLSDLRTPLAFLLGHSELEKELAHLALVPSHIGNTVSSTQQLYTLTGTPARPLGRVTLVKLTVDEDGVIHSMEADEADGTATSFAFDHLHENVPAPAKDFTFTPPPGVSIADGPPLV